MVAKPRCTALWRAAADPRADEMPIAIDGVQTSSRYPGGIALRFARVKAYREDKRPDDADTIGTLRSLLR